MSFDYFESERRRRIRRMKDNQERNRSIVVAMLLLMLFAATIFSLPKQQDEHRIVTKEPVTGVPDLSSYKKYRNYWQHRESKP